MESQGTTVTMSAEHSDLRDQPEAQIRAPRSGPVVEETVWGYIIRASDADHAYRAAGSVLGRFFGAILLLAAAGLWLLPDSLHSADIIGVKVAAMVMFTVLGGYFLWAGRNAQQPEYRIDTTHNEIRIGLRSSGGDFCQSARVEFSDVSSVFLLRAKDRPTRLFLRLADLDTGVELATGPLSRMEQLKDRLTSDLAPPPPRATPTPKRIRPRRIAA